MIKFDCNLHITAKEITWCLSIAAVMRLGELVLITIAFTLSSPAKAAMRERLCLVSTADSGKFSRMPLMMSRASLSHACWQYSALTQMLLTVLRPSPATIPLLHERQSTGGRGQEHFVTGTKHNQTSVLPLMKNNSQFFVEENKVRDYIN